MLSAVSHIRERLNTVGTFQLHLRADEAAALLAHVERVTFERDSQYDYNVSLIAQVAALEASNGE